HSSYYPSHHRTRTFKTDEMRINLEVFRKYEVKMIKTKLRKLKMKDRKSKNESSMEETSLSDGSLVSGNQRNGKKFYESYKYFS
ncbi:hypothetical protein SNEBB_010780, partial [Seison nebaliae]